MAKIITKQDAELFCSNAGYKLEEFNTSEAGFELRACRHKDALILNEQQKRYQEAVKLARNEYKKIPKSQRSRDKWTETIKKYLKKESTQKKSIENKKIEKENNFWI